MIAGGIVSLREALQSLKPMERKVAEYILQHPSEVVHLSVQKLAELAEVSEATIVRLAQSLHYKGFQELKLKIAADLARNKELKDTYQEIQMEGPVASLIDSVSHNNMRSIQDTLSVLQADQVERAIEHLTHAGKIALFGVGASAVIAQDFKQKLTRINRWCESAYDFDSQATIAANLREGDVAFGISYSGRTEDIVQSLTIAKESGTTIVSLTKFGSNPVSELADIRLFTSSLEQSIRSGAMASRIAQLNVIDILFVGVARNNYEENIMSLEKTRQAVKISKRYE
ncbi:putative HTH-type transcriptional regulator YbbH [Paenibacillus sp. CECT 9249]|uniref:MurR/RpiR family transcriptional regulator n=1 Tax=Paenibacillus sp. CECT 9249 TaxID=2845385 RepID=UPI001E4E25C9|nr:MurR/RpiR family transcriptional regulator [Paenibacillus sp. CECT 9249]CAH0121042.1 putative HTH-type transcriptional regulator YbbH [Paenibacillus sp. CECT 9249]